MADYLHGRQPHATREAGRRFATDRSRL